MSLKQKLEDRSVTKVHVKRAIDNMERVLAQTVNNASKNTTGAQAMRGNISTFARDLEVLYELEAEFDKADKAAATRARKIEKPADVDVTEADVKPAKDKGADASEADNG